MAEARNPFAASLARQDALRLKEAFEACNADPELARFHRTTLQRWLDGSVPSRGGFIRRLAEHLDDPDVYTAWETARARPRQADHRAVVEAFELLDEAAREPAYREIRKLYLSRFESVRSRFSMRIDMSDHPGQDDLFQLRVALNWVGRVPARARAEFVTDQTKLGNAYERPECVFRDVLDLDPDRLSELLASGGDQILGYTSLSSDRQTVTRHVARYEGDGIFVFDNDKADHAQIRLSLTYPFPRGVQTFPILFGQYQLSGVAEIILAVHSDAVGQLRGLAFLPPGQRRSWAVETMRDDELVVYAGTPDVILSEGDGVVLSWTERLKAGG